MRWLDPADVTEVDGPTRQILAAARGQGLVDTKVCAFSKTHTALRFVKRKGGAVAATTVADEDEGFDEE